MNGSCGSTDVIATAVQLGRLDFVSMLLTIVGIIIVVGGVFAFINVHRIAKSQATEEAKKVAPEEARKAAEKVAERVAENTAMKEAQRVVNKYLRDELPDMIIAAAGMVASQTTSDDDFAGAQETNEEGDDDGHS